MVVNTAIGRRAASLVFPRRRIFARRDRAVLRSLPRFPRAGSVASFYLHPRFARPDGPAVCSSHEFLFCERFVSARAWPPSDLRGISASRAFDSVSTNPGGRTGVNNSTEYGKESRVKRVEADVMMPPDRVYLAVQCFCVATVLPSDGDGGRRGRRRCAVRGQRAGDSGVVRGSIMEFSRAVLRSTPKRTFWI